jgi:hypothetical protein
MRDSDLVDMGLTAKGDRLKLQAFCRHGEGSHKDEERAEKKRRLKQIIESGKSSRMSTAPSKEIKPKPSLKFEVRWKHFCEGKGYKLKRAEQGGGVRSITIPRDASVDNCLKLLQDVFFPNGKSPMGSINDVDLNLADFKSDPFDLFDEFTAEDYKKKHGLHTPRLVLLSKDKEIIPLSVSSDESADDQDLMTSPFKQSPQNHYDFAAAGYTMEGEVKLETSTTTVNPDEFAYATGSTAYLETSTTTVNPDEFAYATGSTAYLETSTTTVNPDEFANATDSTSTTKGDQEIDDGLVGTSEERKQMMDQLRLAYEASLEADRAKLLQREEENAAIARRELLRRTREKRLLPVPTEDEPQVVARVRHSSLGLITRAFPANSKVIAVYDWVGSLSVIPEHFTLSFVYPQSIIYPDEDITFVASSMLYMLKQDESIQLSRDDNEVEFFSGRPESINNDTLPSQSDAQPVAYDLFDELLSRPPGTLIMEGDTEKSSEEQETLKLIDNLNIKRQYAEQQLEEHHMIEVSRHNCVEDMFEMYKEENITKYRLSLIFKEEGAFGSGVLREAYSSFWDSFVSSYCEGSSNFAFSVSAAITQDNYVAMGRILTHQYIQTGTLPLQISEAAIQQAVIGKVSDECLIHSFLMLLQEKERDVLRKAMVGVDPFPTDEVLDILSEYNATTFPRANNIRNIILQLSVTELVSKPFMCITKLREGMGKFWENVSSEEIHAVYSVCTPTPANVVNSLQFNPEDAKESKVARWVVRYIKNKDQKILSRFLRFCTGSDLVLPDRGIKVQMENMSEASMRPKAQTCFRILTVAKNYRTFAHLSTNLDWYMNNPQVWDLKD